MPRKKARLNPSEVKFWQAANEALPLIRAGHTGIRSLAAAMDKPHSATHRLVRRLVDLGLVAYTPGKTNTLRLVDPDLVSHIRLAYQRIDGVLDKFSPSRPEFTPECARDGGARGSS